MGTLTANTPRLDEHCLHKLPTSCQLSSTPQCCACADKREHHPNYPVYIDGNGHASEGTRWQNYCWYCSKFWTNRILYGRPRVLPQNTRIPEFPDQSRFLQSWYEHQQGFRVINSQGDTEAVIGDFPLKDAEPGCCPYASYEDESYTIDELSDSATEILEAEVEYPGMSLEDLLRQTAIDADSREPQQSSPVEGEQQSPPTEDRQSSPNAADERHTVAGRSSPQRASNLVQPAGQTQRQNVVRRAFGSTQNLLVWMPHYSESLLQTAPMEVFSTVEQHVLTIETYLGTEEAILDFRAAGTLGPGELMTSYLDDRIDCLRFEVEMYDEIIHNVDSITSTDGDEAFARDFLLSTNRISMACVDIFSELINVRDELRRVLSRLPRSTSPTEVLDSDEDVLNELCVSPLHELATDYFGGNSVIFELNPSDYGNLVVSMPASTMAEARVNLLAINHAVGDWFANGRDTIGRLEVVLMRLIGEEIARFEEAYMMIIGRVSAEHGANSLGLDALLVVRAGLAFLDRVNFARSNITRPLHSLGEGRIRNARRQLRSVQRTVSRRSALGDGGRNMQELRDLFPLLSSLRPDRLREHASEAAAAAGGTFVPGTRAQNNGTRPDNNNDDSQGRVLPRSGEPGDHVPPARTNVALENEYEAFSRISREMIELTAALEASSESRQQSLELGADPGPSIREPTTATPNTHPVLARSRDQRVAHTHNVNDGRNPPRQQPLTATGAIPTTTTTTNEPAQVVTPAPPRYQSPSLDADDGRPDEPATQAERTADITCRVCLTQRSSIALLPCGHLAMCTWCADQYIPSHPTRRQRPLRPDAICPLCRVVVGAKVQIFCS